MGAAVHPSIKGNNHIVLRVASVTQDAEVVSLQRNCVLTKPAPAG